jgi:hypothetical protein
VDLLFFSIGRVNEYLFSYQLRCEFFTISFGGDFRHAWWMIDKIAVNHHVELVRRGLVFTVRLFKEFTLLSVDPLDDAFCFFFFLRAVR